MPSSKKGKLAQTNNYNINININRNYHNHSKPKQSKQSSDLKKQPIVAEKSAEKLPEVNKNK